MMKNTIIDAFIYVIPVAFIAILSGMFLYMYKYRAEGHINPVVYPKNSSIECTAGVLVTEAGEYRLCSNEEGGKWKQQIKQY